MKKINVLLPGIVLMIFVSCSGENTLTDKIYSNIPDLEELSGVWVSGDTAAMEPSIRNFQGQALVNENINGQNRMIEEKYKIDYKRVKS